MTYLMRHGRVDDSTKLLPIRHLLENWGLEVVSLVWNFPRKVKAQTAWICSFSVFNMRNYSVSFRVQECGVAGLRWRAKRSIHLGCLWDDLAWWLPGYIEVCRVRPCLKVLHMISQRQVDVLEQTFQFETAYILKTRHFLNNERSKTFFQSGP